MSETDAPKARIALKLIALVGVLLIIGVIGLFVWPTRYRYDRMKVQENDLPVRIDRLTGRTEYLTLTGWMVVGNEKGNGKSESDDQDLAGLDLAKIAGTSSITNYGSMQFEAYNGSDQTVTEVTVRVTVYDVHGNQVLERLYRLLPEFGFGLAPKSSGKFQASLGFTIESGQRWTFSVDSAKGKRAL